MKKKTILVLISLLHICIFCIGISILFHYRESQHTSTNPSSDMTVRLADEELEPPLEVSVVEASVIEGPSNEELFVEESFMEESFVEESSSEEFSFEESFIEESLIEESSSEESFVTESIPPYTFQYVGGKSNLNIRNAPSLQAKIIGKIPPNQSGQVLEFANDDWVLIEYHDTTGYCSLHCLVLTPTAKED